MVLRAATPLDEWLVEGEWVLGGWPLCTCAVERRGQDCLHIAPNRLHLCAGLSGWLEEQYIKRFMGRNELAYK